MTQDQYSYTRGRDGTFDTFTILTPEGEPVAHLHFWGEGDGKGEEARAEKSARVICEHLSQWWLPREPQPFEPDSNVTAD
ncbi:hypothetical protein R5W24_000525 [Gemmata sp. JC717]|uniref:hypothetical protein n=1 Tax=Gemmata algarum TaxID=2975278 RepID=UPI0021BA6244|nr:hypothetical protein [Gemmata algarum]MDY3551449.1 hypothetical protein [Gemmata algarum]